ncbi:Crp/Fnr family transcriptional regulator [Dyadobacter frigoris]|uniref:Crp/Fnr family transcriptional regulator n=1 Tax=Dyadobacter frigoris TaxID=2576211 RepID=A0A4U6D0E9_9BACT|nr:Crp/Fnr family transcriptional regulator [Dyadobacter frigoris]TKT90660.1 Crp/Fnr family transcriptional regulator [Dyadobacter frigoris]GLU51187.1 cAMP-binding protein [Dyadobacter frigoris]
MNDYIIAIRLHLFVYLAMTNVKLLEFLRLLTLNSEESVSLLAGNFESKILQKGNILLKEGEICTAFYFVESGYLRTCYDKGGTEINLYFHMDGSMSSDHRNAKAGIASKFTIKAGEKSEVWILNRKKLEELCYANEQIMVFARRLVSHIALNLNDNELLSKIYSPAERYTHMQKNHPDLLQRISLSNLASYLGIDRRTLTRIRGKK